MTHPEQPHPARIGAREDSASWRLLPLAALIALLFLAKFAVYAWKVTPLWDIPDESGHYSYALDVSHGEWPLLGQARIDPEVMRSWKDTEAEPGGNWIAQHPPLYYALDAPLLIMARAAGMDFEQQVRAARMLTAVLAALTVLGLTLFLAKATGRHELGLAGAIFFAATPMFTHLSTGVTHDVLVACSASWTAYWCVRWLGSGRFRHLLYAGVLAAVCTVTKITALAMTVPLFFALAWRLWSVRPNGMASWYWLRRVGALWLVMFGPICLWIGRNVAYFGRMFPDSVNIHAVQTVPIGFIEFLVQHPVWRHTLLNFVALVGWNGGEGGPLAWIQANGLVAQYFLALLGAGAIGAVTVPLLGQTRTLTQPHAAHHAPPWVAGALAAVAVGLLIHVIFSWPLLHLVQRTCLLLAAAFIVTPVLNARGALSGDSTSWLLATAALCTLTFALIYSEHLRDAFTGNTRATHGRYLYPVVPFMLLVLLRPFRGEIASRTVLAAAVLAMVVADGFFLHQVFQLYGQLPT